MLGQRPDVVLERGRHNFPLHEHCRVSPDADPVVVSQAGVRDVGGGRNPVQVKEVAAVVEDYAAEVDRLSEAARLRVLLKDRAVDAKGLQLPGGGAAGDAA